MDPITGLIIPVEGNLVVVELEPMDRDAYRAALGGVGLHEVAVAPLWRSTIDIFTSREPGDRTAPANSRASWFIGGEGTARGAALFVGTGGTDVPMGFLEYLYEQNLLGSRLEF